MNSGLMEKLASAEKIVKGFAAAREPEENKLTTLMPPGVELTYSHADAGKNTSGETVRFCTADHPNVAGYYLGWRETVKTRGGEEGTPRRREWVASKNPVTLEKLAKRRAEKFQANCAKARQRRIDRKATATRHGAEHVVQQVSGAKGKTKGAGPKPKAKAKAKTVSRSAIIKKGGK